LKCLGEVNSPSVKVLPRKTLAAAHSRRQTKTREAACNASRFCFT